MNEWFYPRNHQSLNFTNQEENKHAYDANKHEDRQLYTHPHTHIPINTLTYVESPGPTNVKWKRLNWTDLKA